MSFEQKIKNKQAVIGVIGLGYVGLPLVLKFAEVGFKVYGFDTDKEKIENLKKGKSYISHIPGQRIKSILDRLIPTSDMDLLSKPDAIIICVPTPLTKHREPDIRFIEETTRQIAKNLRQGQLIALESTTYPGTTREILLAEFLKTGLKAGRDFFLVFSPEREDPGNTRFTTGKIPKVVGGITPACKKLGILLYQSIIEKIVPVSSVEVAESVKLLENIYRAVNIALVNELKVLFDRMDINIWEVIEAAKTKPFGFHPFYPGPGLGGHCIPIDPFYLTWKAREYDFHTNFIELAGEINAEMPYYVIQRLTEALGKNSKALPGSKILIIGIAYKKNTEDIRESPGIKIMKTLEHSGAGVDYYDPYVPQVIKSRQIEHALYSINPANKKISSYDAVVIVTDHSNIDYQTLLKHSRMIIDTRNVYKKPLKKVFRA
ncbi:MAG: nucleotide sugar dehydrogenase [Candidatus Omnitrophica bacterium]|nr:nucleotide sugar dehydrogenase [Candidatus Omnitrophota bacterium]